MMMPSATEYIVDTATVFLSILTTAIAAAAPRSRCDKRYNMKTTLTLMIFVLKMHAQFLNQQKSYEEKI